MDLPRGHSQTHISRSHGRQCSRQVGAWGHWILTTGAVQRRWAGSDSTYLDLDMATGPLQAPASSRSRPGSDRRTAFCVQMEGSLNPDG
eukprot:1645997-Prymnesium_polylepis.2